MEEAEGVVAAEGSAVPKRQIARWSLRSRQARSRMLQVRIDRSRYAFGFSWWKWHRSR